jgi:hypothetical protein
LLEHHRAKRFYCNDTVSRIIVVSLAKIVYPSRLVHTCASLDVVVGQDWSGGRCCLSTMLC